VPDGPDTAETIVVPLDGSELADRAVPVAIRLAHLTDARIELLAIGADDHADALRTHLATIAASSRGVPVGTAVVSARDTADAIVDFADARGASICMTSHGRGGLRWAVLGSVAEGVVAGAARPVLLVGPRAEDTWAPGPGPVLVAHDGGHLGDAVVDAACEWARRLDTSILLTTVIHPLDAEDAERPAALFTEPEQRIRARGCAVDHLVVQRHFPAGVLADVAVDRRVPLIVMGSHGRHGLERLVVGSTTMAVLALVPCPVMATPPPVEEA
jgi:nucleotide-binding universal stress UspA family protein